MINAVFFFANGNAIVYDEHGEQIPVPRTSWLTTYFDSLIEAPAPLALVMAHAKQYTTTIKEATP